MSRSTSPAAQLAFLFTLLISFHAKLSAQDQTAQYQRLDTYLTALNANDKAMTAVYVSQNGNLLYQHYAGMASVKQQVPITAKTKFRIGSITKVFTAVLIMQLIEQDKLTLDSKLSRFYPDIPNAQDITIKHLLSHRSGIKSYTSEPEYQNYMTQKQSKQQIEQRIESYPSLFEPNSQHQYSNSNYTLLGYIIESLYQKTYAQVLSEKIASPLNLTSTYYGDSIELAQNEALSYRFNGNWVPQPATHMSVPHAAGAIVSTAQETNVFLTALFAGKLVSASSLDAMMDLEDGYGLGMYAVPFYQHKFYGHNGGIDGFQSATGHNLADGVTLTVLTNGINYNFNGILIAVLSSVYQREVAIPDFSVKPVALPAKTLRQYLGNFGSDALPLEIDFTLADQQLFAQATGQSKLPLTAYSETEFRFEQAGIVIKFAPASLTKGTFNQFTLHQGGGQFLFTRKD